MRATSTKLKNINLEAARIHILTDLILSIGVVLSAIIIYFTCPEPDVWTPWQLFDPLCTYIFSFLAIYSTWSILKEAVLLLLDASHSPTLVPEIER
jgi:Co/Zn/Cd efflux system component